MALFLKLAIATLALLLFGCGSSEFIVKSDPPVADVFYIDQAGQKKSLGKTPLTMSTSDVKNVAGADLSAGNFFRIGVEKPGYQSETFSVPASQFGTMITDIEVKLKQGDSEIQAKTAKDVLNSLFLAQRFALSQQFERAQIEIDKILTVFPNFPRALSMRGAIFFAQKNYPESLKWYEEALKADPQMEDVVKIAGKLRSLQGGSPRAPASPTETKPSSQ